MTFTEKRAVACTKRGFTLIELLVVVSIIALLVSILLPALGKAREQAKRVVCASGSKQLGVGFHLYAEDNKDAYPAWELYNGQPVDSQYRIVNHLRIIDQLVEYDKGKSTGSRLFPNYIDQAKAFYCVNNDLSEDPERWSPGYGGYNTWSSYCYLGGGNDRVDNNRGTTYNSGKVGKSPVKTSDLGPARPILQDSVVINPSNNDGHMVNHTRQGRPNTDNVAGANVLYTDTRVEWQDSYVIMNAGKILWSTGYYYFAVE